MSQLPASPTAAVVTLGCKVNQYESEAFAEALVAAGFTVRPAYEACDVYILNTCTVTSESDRKSRQAVRRLIGQNPDARVIVTGCSAQSHPDSFLAIPGVDAVIGNRRKMDVVTCALSLMENGKSTAAPVQSVSSLDGSGFEPMTITRFDRTRAYVKIEDGCQSRCTYCAIPDARGPIRSKPLGDVLAEVGALTRSGCREIVLTGIETGSWGFDLGKERLGDLLCAVSTVPGIGRIRLGSLDPSVMNRHFIDCIAGLSCIAPHFHLSVQSGCSATLARMKRKYNADQALAAMERLRAAIPGVKFTTDMIVGFPGETEAEFAESVAFARKAGFLHIHVFPYSRREGTPADRMPNQIPDAVKHERVGILSAVSTETCTAILDEALAAHAPLRVLFESREEHPDGTCFTGHTPDFMEVRVRTDADLRGTELDVLPTARDGEVLLAALPPCVP